MSTKYIVTIESFAKKHYLKKIKKKYKKSFDKPWSAFEIMLQKFDLMLERKYANAISSIDNTDIIICKTGFKIMPNESVKSSGNRCIVAQDLAKREVKVLLVYHKNDVPKSGGETEWFKQMIKNNYFEYKDL